MNRTLKPDSYSDLIAVYITVIILSKHKYLLDKSFDGKVKAEFFEMSAKFYIEKESVLPMEIYEKITVKNIVENEDNKLGKIIYSIQK